MKLIGHSAAVWAVDMMPELGLMITGVVVTYHFDESFYLVLD